MLLASSVGGCQNLDALDRCRSSPCELGPSDGSALDAGAQDVAAADGGPDPYAAQVLGSSPLAYYRLDEGSGDTVAHDSSGHGHDCAYSPGVIQGVHGAVGNNTALRVSAQGSGVYCASSLFAFSGTEAFSVEAFYAPDAIESANFQSAFSRIESSPRTGYYLYLHAQPDPGATFEIWGAGTALCGAHGAPFPCAGAAVDGGGAACGRFAHVVATYDGSTLSVFVDGKLGASAACSAIPDAGAVDFTMGNFSGFLCPTCAMLGVLDELAVYDRALALDEVQRHYGASGL